MTIPIITLITDFGLKDSYVSEIKGVILSISPACLIVDITHQIEKFNIRMGGFLLASASKYFPENTVHVGVVDPGVGTERRSIIIETMQSYLVGPDNGLLFLAAKNQRVRRIHEITNKELMSSNISNTFHGRDIFAHAAAHLAKGVLPAEFGPPIQGIVEPAFAKVKKKGNKLIGEVLHIDGFGNVITNIEEKDVKARITGNIVKVELPKAELRLEFCKAYSEVETGKTLAIVGGHGLLEISINRGNAADEHQIEVGDKISTSFSS